MSTKSVFISLVFACLLLIGALAYYLYPHKLTPKTFSLAETVPILLYVESGEVSYKIPGASVTTLATTSPIAIPNQTFVKTGIGRASVLLPDNSSIALDENTEITVSYSEEKTSIYQTLGTTYHRVEALLTGGTYQVQTPGTLAAVRGTKFAVKYDLTTKKTKVAVTENKVEVSTITRVTSVTGTGTSSPKEEKVIVEEGKTVIVETDFRPTRTKPSAIETIDTNKDPEIKVWIDRQEPEDVKIETIKRDTGDKEEQRTLIRKVLFNDESKEEKIEIKRTIIDDSDMKDSLRETMNEEAVRVETSVPKTTVPVTTEVNPIIKPATEIKEPVPITDTTNTQTTIVKKMDEETFFNAFNDLFIKYFYLDDRDTPCTVTLLADARVKAVTSFGATNGYPFTSTTLLSFAQGIDAYCKNRDAAAKPKLQQRFDQEFPYQEDI